MEEPLTQASKKGFRTALRRIDWRFLLPQKDNGYEKLSLIGDASGAEDLVLATGTARAVHRTLPTDASADAVVVLANGWVTASDLRRAIKPHGVFLWEVDRRRHPSMTPSRCGRLLRRAGLAVNAAYWVMGTHEHCSMYMPFNSSGAMSWAFQSYVEHQLRGTWALSMAQAGIRVAPQLATRAFPALVRAFSIVGSLDQGSAPLPGFLKTKGIVPEELLAQRPEAVLLTRGAGRVAALVFPAGAKVPVLVVKVQRTPKAESHSRCEWNNLRTIRSLLSEEMRRSVPTPVTESLWQKLEVASQTFMPGHVPQGVDDGPDGQRRALTELRAAGAWLRQFHRETTVGRVPASELLIAASEVSIPKLMAARDVSIVERRFFELYRDRASRLTDVMVPKVWEHRDFQNVNIYHTVTGGVTVLDWEGAREGLGLRDQILFTSEWLWVSRSSQSQYGQPADFRKLFLDAEPSDPLVAAARAETAAYMSVMKMDPSLLPLTLVDVLIRLASKYDRHAKCLSVIAAEPDGFFEGFGRNGMVVGSR